ncbi:serine hydrolase domain-containing protein [Lentzea sp. BCCO 10_0856]|uniref:Serine hydrolase domain-containing protein n=1 Tax=Lentzea miocenica TaxID=3095431 RepID=A0ABU4T4F5_9PSEU|nr:serine hydrolase domain-containing protein [Lentzea sp. BCCO 10_0856]MDX8033050.1 serine hydrolase domain-containing protein [Lentzea sp. BCCO 10_0856]
MNDWITRRLPELLEEHGIVGAQVAVLHNGEIVDAAAGVRNNVTNEPVTSDTLFQIGSITKVWTATLIMQLVNEGLLDLDRPVRDVLPEFRTADEQAAKVITPRQLLCHTAGFEGDLKFETGSGDDMLERYVELLADAGQFSPPGELYSYCNSGYAVLGRIVEVLRGKTFTAVLHERLVDPLGLTKVAAARVDYAEHEMADGHLEGKPATQHMPESWVAGGSVLAMPARELLEFVRMHLDTTEFDAMRERQATHPDFGTGEWWWGLGWELSNFDGGEVIGHTGMTMGFVSMLRVVPAAGVAVIVMANGGKALGPFFAGFFDHLLSELAGVSKRKLPDVPADPAPVDPDKVVGLYRDSALDVHITPGEHGTVKVRLLGRDPLTAALISAEETEYVHLLDDLLIAVDKSSTLPLGGRDEHGRVGWVHWSRAAMRI